MMEEPFDWKCDVCGRSIANEKGYLTVDLAAADEAERIWREYEREYGNRPLKPVTLTVLQSLPGTVKWERLHYRCDPRKNDGDYWFCVSRIRTLRQMIDWTAHLMGKPWIGYTDWDQVIRDTGGVFA